jgi:hypothetical protein
MRKYVAFAIATAVVFGTGIAAVTTASAGADLIKYPENYQSTFVRYTTVDQEPQKRVRFMHVNPEVLAAAKAGEPAPYGTVLVMEDHRVQLDGSGNPVKDSKGRLIPTSEVFNVFVQEKQRGWGKEYPDDLRNGEWEYASFQLDGKHKEGQKYENCFKCHKDNAAKNDYMFSFPSFLAKMNK